MGRRKRGTAAGPRRGFGARRGRAGFSLVEVLVAVAVFAFAILAMAVSSGLVSKQMKAARRDLRLAFAMQQKMEELLALGWANLTPGTTADTVAGFPMTIQISGTNPKVIRLIAQYRAEPGLRAGADTLLTMVAQP